jgi:CRP-like cAMP-binding protein
MKQINEKNLINKYFEKYKLDEILTPEAKDISQIIEFAPGEEILKTGDNLENYYIFLEGRLKVYSIQENGKHLLLKFYGGFDTLGDIELISGMKISSTVVAVKESILIRMPAGKLKSLVYDYPPFLRYSMNNLGLKLHNLSNHSAHNLLYPLKNRLASFIHVQAEGDELILSDKFIDIAEYLGTTYRHLSREMNSLENEKIITRKKNIIKVLSEDNLKELAGNIY